MIRFIAIKAKKNGLLQYIFSKKKKAVKGYFATLVRKLDISILKHIPSINIYISPYIFSKVKIFLNLQKKVERISITSLL